MEISEIKAQLTITQVLDHYGLKADKSNRLCCPFHEDKTPSMQIYLPVGPDMSWERGSRFAISTQSKDASYLKLDL